MDSVYNFLDFLIIGGSIFCFSWLGVLKLPVLAGDLQRKGKLKKEIFCDLQARQFTQLYLVLGTILLLIACLLLGFAYCKNSNNTMEDISIVALWIVLPSTIILLLAAANTVLWKKVPFAKRANKWKQTLLTAFAEILAIISLFLCLFVALCLLIGIPPSLEGFARLGSIFRNGSNETKVKLVLSLIAILCYARSYAAAFGLCWLFLRRNKDDFGRDYYTISLSRTAKSALANLLCTIVLLSGMLLLKDIPTTWYQAKPLLILLAPSLFACLLWGHIWRAKIPMRHAWESALALILLLTSGVVWATIMG